MASTSLFYLRYSTTVPKTSVGTLQGPILAYVAVPQLDPNDPTGNITIVDESFNFPENTTLYSNQVIQFTGGFNAAIPTNNILVTTYYTNATNSNPNVPLLASQPVRPLWYQFIFPNSTPIIQQPNGTYAITITDNNGATIDNSHYQLWPTTGQPTAIYTDLINNGDTWYYINYLSTNNTVKKQLLSVTPIYDPVASNNPGTNQYTIQQNAFSGLWQININIANGNYPSILPIGNSNIEVLHPIQALSTSQWYCQITNGYFQRNIPDPNNGSLRSYRYFIPEYQSQAWYPNLPYMFQAGETPVFIDNTTIRLRNIPLMQPNIQANQLYIYITNSTQRSNNTNYLINTAGGLTDTSLYIQSNNNVPSQIWYRLIIDSIDTNSGLVSISGIQSPDGTITFTTGDDALLYNSDSLLAFYYFQELNYIFNKINLNPVFNPQLLNIGVSLYIQPAQYSVNNISGNNSAVTSYLLFDNNEMIIGTSDSGVPTNGTVSLTQFYTGGDGSGIPGIFQDRTTFLELARIFVRNTSILDNILNGNLVDARIQGGQLMQPVPPEIQNIINNNTNEMWPLFNWHGIIMPGNSVVVIQLPYYLTYDDYTAQGNPLSGQDLINRLLDLRRTVKKNMAFGVLPILRFYDAAGNPMDSLNPPLDQYQTYVTNT